MQKVISITTSLKRDVKIYEIVEEEYKELNKFLDDGYKIVDKFTIIPSNESSLYAIIFILEKIKVGVA